MADNLRDFLIDLGTNEKTKEDYRKDPEATMDNAGLSDEEKQWMRDGNLDEINKNIGDAHTAGRWIDITEN